MIAAETMGSSRKWTATMYSCGDGRGVLARHAKPGDEITVGLQMTRLRAPLVVFNGQGPVEGQALARAEGPRWPLRRFQPQNFSQGNSTLVEARPAATDGNHLATCPES